MEEETFKEDVSPIVTTEPEVDEYNQQSNKIITTFATDEQESN